MNEGKNPRNAGRKPTGLRRVSICISGQPEDIAALKKMAKEAKMTVSKFIMTHTVWGQK